jgi:hypothetical protein
LIASGAVLPSLMRGRAFVGLAPWAAVGLIPILGAAVAWLALRRAQREKMIAAVSTAAIAFLGVIALGPIHIIEAQKAAKPLIELAGACRPLDEVRCASFCYFQPSLVFYCRREVPELQSERDAVDFLKEPLPAYLICPADVGAALMLRLPGIGVLARHRDFYKGWEIVVLGNDGTKLSEAANCVTLNPLPQPLPETGRGASRFFALPATGRGPGG